MNWILIGLIVVGVVVLVVGVIIFSFVGVWVKVFFNSVLVGMGKLVGLKFVGILYSLIVDVCIIVVCVGILFSVDLIVLYY